MELSNILKQKKVVAKILATENAKIELLSVAKELKKEGYGYLLFSDNCLHLAKENNGVQDVIYLEVFNQKLWLSKYRYGKETKVRIVRSFSRHKHTTASKWVA